MKAALINASPKLRGSASGTLVADIKNTLPPSIKSVEFKIYRSFLKPSEVEALKECAIWVFVFPLYVDGLPSHLLSCLCQLEEAGLKDHGITVYGVANCGFYEGHQTKLALETLEIWSEKAQLKWGMGIGFGGGGALAQMAAIPLGKGPKKSLGQALNHLSETMFMGESRENQYLSLGIPRFFYKAAAEHHWKQRIKANKRAR
ncbi:MAG: NAD(P)H-dependent oxidoreductase [Turicibacter sp.]|nr:NAD(P)H-dependent oxidoreductase [Turicibacter sp.]